MRYALGFASCVFVVAVALSATGQAGQLRAVTDGVYSAGQARRGQQTYEARCVMCHGAMLEGAVGPPLTGAAFLSAWNGRPLADLADKIQKTMPLEQPAACRVRRRSTWWRTSFRPAGFPRDARAWRRGPRTDCVSGSAGLPGAGSRRGVPALTPAANLAQLMRGVTFRTQTSSSTSR